MQTLSQYLAETGTRQEDFAKRVGATQATISRLKAGSLTPSLGLAARIERETGGAVPMVSWVSKGGPTPKPPREPLRAAS